MNRKIVKIIFSLFMTAAILCIGFLVFATHQAQGNPDKIPSFGGYKPFTVLTNSMQPKISAGDMIFVEEKKAANIKKGDIITFKISDGKLITHRVVSVTKQGFMTKGDNNNVRDKWLVKPENIIGTAAVIVPKAGNIAKFLASPAGFSIFIILPLLLLVLIEVYQRILKALNRKEDPAVTES
ncbi:signal peptidase I [Bacillus sp. MUM 13]|uniref:signal peptidase I n=1 Tax=Bacillus sp. MUM 13 TaxID=1678001 RepID=UPI0008F58B63|nr:signal peptidase I [Bacillus sp. MUM 13]